MTRTLRVTAIQLQATASGRWTGHRLGVLGVVAQPRRHQDEHARPHAIHGLVLYAAAAIMSIVAT